VTLGESPVDRVGQCVFAEVAQDRVIDFERREVCYDALVSVKWI
jgi:hypothetical protein